MSGLVDNWYEAQTSAPKMFNLNLFHTALGYYSDNSTLAEVSFARIRGTPNLYLIPAVIFALLCLHWFTRVTCESDKLSESLSGILFVDSPVCQRLDFDFPSSSFALP